MLLPACFILIALRLGLELVEVANLVHPAGDVAADAHGLVLDVAHRDALDHEGLDLGPVLQVAVLVDLDHPPLALHHADPGRQVHAGRQAVAAAWALILVLAAVVHVDQRRQVRCGHQLAQLARVADHPAERLRVLFRAGRQAVHRVVEHRDHRRQLVLLDQGLDLVGQLLQLAGPRPHQVERPVEHEHGQGLWRQLLAVADRPGRDAIADGLLTLAGEVDHGPVVDGTAAPALALRSEPAGHVDREEALAGLWRAPDAQLVAMGHEATDQPRRLRHRELAGQQERRLGVRGVRGALAVRFALAVPAPGCGSSSRRNVVKARIRRSWTAPAAARRWRLCRSRRR